jgi:alkane 1-monooxygenase
MAGAHGWRWAWWLGPIWVFGLVPLLDLLSGVDQGNPPPEAEPELERDPWYRWCTFLYAPLQLVGLVWSCHLVGRAEWAWPDGLGFALTVGTVGGIGIANAHELGHKKVRGERWLARVVLAQTAYGHFYVEHNRGHHDRVATPEDPASARLGESFWAFWPRTVVGSVRSAWQLEATRLARHGQPVWSRHNEVLVAWSMTLALYGGLALAFGPGVLGFLAVQAVFGFSLLEAVNYIEHYGLARQRLPNGRYERCRPEHSWNANQIASNLLLYHLQRHSDHHAWPARRYQALRHFDEAPQLPAGYGALIPLALVPPLWRRVMDPRVVAHYGGDRARANVQPSSHGQRQQARA